MIRKQTSQRPKNRNQKQPEEFNIEAIEDIELIHSGDFLFFVKWQGYPRGSNTWITKNEFKSQQYLVECLGNLASGNHIPKSKKTMVMAAIKSLSSKPKNSTKQQTKETRIEIREISDSSSSEGESMASFEYIEPADTESSSESSIKYMEKVRAKRRDLRAENLYGEDGAGSKNDPLEGKKKRKCLCRKSNNFEGVGSSENSTTIEKSNANIGGSSDSHEPYLFDLNEKLASIETPIEDESTESAEDEKEKENSFKMGRLLTDGKRLWCEMSTKPEAEPEKVPFKDFFSKYEYMFPALQNRLAKILELQRRVSNTIHQL